MKYQIAAPLTCSRAIAFTLVEIALSLGIASFALIGILGVIPVAVGTAKKARDETCATFIALSIIETLRSGPEGEGLVQVDSKPQVPLAFESVPLRTTIGTVTHDLAYDTEGTFLGRMSGYQYETGEAVLPGTVFVARLILQTDNDLIRTEVSIETPAMATESSRRKYSYVTFIRP